MYEYGYMYFRFDSRHLEFLSDIGVCYHMTKTSLRSPNKNIIYNVILFSHITHTSVVSYVLPYLLLILDEFHQSKYAYMTSCLLRSRDAIVVKSMLSCRDLFVHKVIQNFCHIYLDKKVTQQRMLWEYISPICNRRV